MSVSFCLQDAWTCWPPTATSPSPHPSHSWPAPPSSSASPMRSSVWSCMTSALTAAPGTSSRLAPLPGDPHPRTRPFTSSSCGSFRKFTALHFKPSFHLFLVFFLIKMMPNRVKAAFRGEHRSHFPEQSVGRAAFSCDAKPAS